MRACVRLFAQGGPGRTTPAARVLGYRLRRRCAAVRWDAAGRNATRVYWGAAEGRQSRPHASLRPGRSSRGETARLRTPFLFFCLFGASSTLGTGQPEGTPTRYG